MNTEKLWRKLLEDENIKNIPLNDVIKVVIAVFEVINSGECYYETE